MGYQRFQETVHKAQRTAIYGGKIFGFAVLLQLFIFSFLFTKEMKVYPAFNVKILAKSYIKKDAELKKEQLSYLIKAYPIPLLISFSSYFVIFTLFYFFNKRKIKQEHRGTRLIELLELVKQLKRYKDKYLRIGGYDKSTHILTHEDDICLKTNKKQELIYRKNFVEIPEKIEFTHFIVIGKSGSGKTSLINPIVSQMIERSDRMIVHDYKGDFTKNFYSEHRDLIFNPTKPQKCVKWSVFNDIDSKEDIKSIANSLIPEPSKNEDPFWKTAAKDILIGCLISLREFRKTTNQDIYNLVVSNNEEIEKVLQSSQEASIYAHYFNKSNQKTLNSIMSIFRTYTSCFEYLKEIDGDFSIKEWVATSSKNIYIQNKENIKEAIAPALTLFIDTVSRELLSHDDRDFKTVFILDEFGRLNKMSSILDLLTNGRSKGASVWILLQEFSQIDAKYGKDGRKTIVNTCSSQFYFAINEAESARELSEQIGDAETINEDESIYHQTDDLNGFNVRKSLQTKKVVLASEILNLKEREFYMKLNGFNWCKNKVFIQKI